MGLSVVLAALLASAAAAPMNTRQGALPAAARRGPAVGGRPHANTPVRRGRAPVNVKRDKLPENPLVGKPCADDYVSAAAGDPFDKTACVETNPCILIYNRMPKTGSTSMYHGMDSLNRHNNFTLMGGFGYREYRVEYERAMHRLVKIRKHGARVLSHPHFFFFEELASATPRMAFVNMLRHPVDRFVSSYFFERGRGRIRSADIDGYIKSHLDPPVAANIHNRTTYDIDSKADTLEVMREHLHNFATKWLCGRKPVCSENSRETLEEAKRNLVERHLVVGTLDRFDEVLRVLEKKVPGFLLGLHRQSHGRRDNSQGGGGSHHRTSARVIDMITSVNELDIELYKFAQKEFAKQAKACGVA